MPTRPTVALFAFTAALGAALLFAVQPMAGKALLPALGGSPGVWNSALVFFQTTLLAGYALAHLIASRRRAHLFHIPLALAAAASLWLWITFDLNSITGLTPSLTALAALALLVGLPFLFLSTLAPLLQRWYAHVASGANPYRLYAASNIGSFTGLLAYPLLAEPFTSLTTQRLAWSLAFIFLCAILILIWKQTASPPPRSLGEVSAARTEGPEPPTSPNAPGQPRLHPFRTILCAFLPSSLLLGTTQHLTVDVAPLPLLWSLPLAGYLLTFIIAFGVNDASRLARKAGRAAVFALIAMALVLALKAREPLPVIIVIDLAALFTIALACHAKAAALAPHHTNLTGFYLLLSLGGALGGAFNALLAPVIFNDYHELPLALVLTAAALAPTMKWKRPIFVETLVMVVGAPVAFVGSFFLLMAVSNAITSFSSVSSLVAGLSALIAFSVSRFRAGFAVALLITMSLPSTELLREDSAQPVAQHRTYFGVHTVENIPFDPYTEDASAHQLFHGTTVHGLQSFNHPTRPLTYYHPRGPLGDVFTALDRSAPKRSAPNRSAPKRSEDAGDERSESSDPPTTPLRIAAVGLGAGALAAYLDSNDTLDVYEIDPAVIEIATDPDLFTYLSGSPATINYIVGDARQTLDDTTSRYDLIVLDAFTSDAVPAHLLTAEAFELYRARLAPSGLIAFHISNRYLDLAPIVGAGGEHVGLATIARADDPPAPKPIPNDPNLGRRPSRWAVLYNDREHLGPLARNIQWFLVDTRNPWTDDRHSLVTAIDWPALARELAPFK